MRRGRWMALLGLAVLLGGSAARAESQDDRIERLEQRLRELQREIEELKAQRTEARAAAPAPSGQTAAPAASPPVRAASVPAAEAEGAPAATEAPVHTGLLGGLQLGDRLQIGGYGSVRFEDDSARDENATFTLRRLVLTGDAAVASRLRTYFELEFERFRELELENAVVSENGGLTIKQSVDGTNESEISLEQAWLEFELLEALKIRAGAVLVPLGRFNLNHDDNRWDIARRPLADRGAPVPPVPVAWDEVGAGANGEVPLGEQGALRYQLYVVNGAVLQPEVEAELVSVNDEGGEEKVVEAEFSPSNGTFGEDFKDAKAVTGRLAFSPRLGQELAGSFYHGRYTPDVLPSADVTSFGADGLSIWGPFEIEGEYLHSYFADVDGVTRAFAGQAVADEAAVSSSALESTLEFAINSIADTRQGYWLETRYRFRPDWLKKSIFGRGFEDPVLTAVFRGEQVWFGGLLQGASFAAGQLTGLEKDDRRIDRLTIGGSYRPMPLVVFQLAYEFTRVDRGGLDEVTNYLDTSDDKNHAILLGAAFGF